jgi:hypothetical protein
VKKKGRNGTIGANRGEPFTRLVFGTGLTFVLTALTVVIQDARWWVQDFTSGTGALCWVHPQQAAEAFEKALPDAFPPLYVSCALFVACLCLLAGKKQLPARAWLARRGRSLSLVGSTVVLTGSVVALSAIGFGARERLVDSFYDFSARRVATERAESQGDLWETSSRAGMALFGTFTLLRVIVTLTYSYLAAALFRLWRELRRQGRVSEGSHTCGGTPLS